MPYDRGMLNETEVANLPYSNTVAIEHWAANLEREARYEEARAKRAEEQLKSGQRAVGPESYADLFDLRSRMARNRYNKAAMYRWVLLARYETGTD